MRIVHKKAVEGPFEFRLIEALGKQKRAIESIERDGREMMTITYKDGTKIVVEGRNLRVNDKGEFKRGVAEKISILSTDGETDELLLVGTFDDAIDIVAISALAPSVRAAAREISSDFGPLLEQLAILVYGSGGTEFNGSRQSDYILSTVGDDTTSLGEGDDSYVASVGRDTVNGGKGQDVLFAANLFEEVTTDFNINVGKGTVRFTEDGTNGVTRFKNFETFITADGDDVVKGGRKGEPIFTSAGDDSINGGRGRDSLFAGEGNDTVLGGVGSDVISGDEGNDLISGGGGKDQINGGLGNDSINGDAGDDQIQGNEGDDDIEGGAGADSLLGGGGNDIILGGDGDDFILGDTGQDVISGGAGNDTIYGGSDADTFIFGVGNTAFGDDVITDYEGIDTLQVYNNGVEGSIAIVGENVVITSDLGSVVLANTNIDEVSVQWL